MHNNSAASCGMDHEVAHALTTIAAASIARTLDEAWQSFGIARHQPKSHSRATCADGVHQRLGHAEAAKEAGSCEQACLQGVNCFKAACPGIHAPQQTIHMQHNIHAGKRLLYALTHQQISQCGLACCNNDGHAGQAPRSTLPFPLRVFRCLH